MGWPVVYQSYSPSKYQSIADYGNKEDPDSVNEITSETVFSKFIRPDANEKYVADSMKVVVEKATVHFINTNRYDYHYPFVAKYMNETRYVGGGFFNLKLLC